MNENHSVYIISPVTTKRTNVKDYLSHVNPHSAEQEQVENQEQRNKTTKKRLPILKQDMMKQNHPITQNPSIKTTKNKPRSQMTMHDKSRSKFKKTNKGSSNVD